MTDSTLLILGGGLLASVLAALIFTPRKAGEDEQTREMRKLMTALEAQRRIRDAQQAREQRQRGAFRRPPAMSVQAPVRVADPPPAPAPPPARAPAPVPVPAAEAYIERIDPRAAERERKAALAAEQAERRAAEQQRKRDERELAAARKAELDAEREARRQTEHARKAALDAEQAERRAAEQQRKREEKEQAAARKAELDAERGARRQAEQEHVAPLAVEHHRPEFEEHELVHEATLEAERVEVPPTEEPIRPEIAERPLTASARRDLDEIERWREEDDRKAFAKAARTRRRVSTRLYKRQEDAYAAEQKSERETEEHSRRAEQERRAALEAEEARRTAERQRANEAMERAAALESKRKADAEALRRAEEERNKALEAERAEHLAAERRREQEATPKPWTADPDHMAALNAERHALELKRQELRVAEKQEAEQAPAAPDEGSDEKPRRLADLPLYSWAHANEDEDEPPAEPD